MRVQSSMMENKWLEEAGNIVSVVRKQRGLKLGLASFLIVFSVLRQSLGNGVVHSELGHLPSV